MRNRLHDSYRAHSLDITATDGAAITDNDEKNKQWNSHDMTQAHESRMGCIKQEEEESSSYISNVIKIVKNAGINISACYGIQWATNAQDLTPFAQFNAFISIE